MFLGQGLLWNQLWNRLNPTDQNISDSGCSSSGDSQGSAGNLERVTSHLKDSLIELASNQEEGQAESSYEIGPRPKRRRLDDKDSAPALQFAPCELDGDISSRLPDDLVDSLVETYFSLIHHWIPMLHVRHFREKLVVPSERKSMETILDAIVSVCSRFSNDPRLGDAEARAKVGKQTRQKVILQSIESFSVENLQALIICAFDTVGNYPI